MSKNTASDKHRNPKSRLSPSQLTRQPIHWRTEEAEEDGDDEIGSDSRDELYPLEDLNGELEEIRKQTVQNQSERGKKRQSPKYDIKPKEEAGKSSDFFSFKNILIFLLSVVMLLFGINSFQSEKPASDRTIDLTEFISGMKNKFEGQDLQTFRILKTSLKNMFNKTSKPASPSIFTVITNKGAEITASEFSAYIAQEVASEHYVSINESVIHRNPDKLKYAIDTEIKSKFDNRSLNVAVVDRFHNIPIDAAMIFHTYCDHENAPFKRAIFLFIVHLNRNIPENSSLKLMDATAMDALRFIWRDASDDIVDSLITRLTANVINIK